MRHMSQEVGVLGVSHECVAKASKYPYYMRLVSQNYLLCVNTYLSIHRYSQNINVWQNSQNINVYSSLGAAEMRPDIY